MIPKINLRYSWIYDQNWKEWIKDYKTKFECPYPSSKKVLSYMKQVEKPWRKEEKRIFKELSKVSGLEWQEEEIPCYVVGRAIPFSDPLTVPVYRSRTWFIDILTHETIHQLFTQGDNRSRTDRAWKYLFDKYEEETQKTIIHIPLHALHKHIYLKFFGERRLGRNIEMMNHLSDYRRAWEIVERDSYKEIIEGFRGRLK